MEGSFGELERRIGAGRIARWFGGELSSLLRLLRQTVAAAPPERSNDDFEAAQRIQTAARACSARVSTLLALRAEPRQNVSAHVATELSLLLAENPSLRARGVRAEGLDAATVPLPPALLRAVLKALLENACEVSASPPELSVCQGDLRGLFIESEGTLAPDVARKAPFPFFTTKPGHAGLGLSLVHATAENQGGYLEISAGSRGTRVGIVFPSEPRQTPAQDADGNVSFSCHLAAGLAHDVNNALMAALGWAEILADARDEAEREEALATLSQAADYLEAMSYLLPYEEGPPPSEEGVDLGPAIERMRPLLRAVLEHKADRKIALRVSSVEGARVSMSEDALRAVVLHLAENAREAMPSGGTWTIACDVRPEHLLLTLSADRGADQTSDQARKGRAAGTTALGLAVARDLVQAIGGSLEIGDAASSHSNRPNLPIPSARIRLPGSAN